MSKKKLFLIALTLVFILIASACGSNSTGNKDASSKSGNEAPKEEAIVLKFAHTADTNGQFHFAAVTFQKLVDEKTAGKVKIEIYPNKVLGVEKELLEGLRLGTVDMMTGGSANITYISDLQLLTMPYIFKDKEHTYAVLDGEIGQSMLAKLDNYGIVGLAFWENGFRNLTNDVKPVKSVEDLKGLKIRTQEVPLQVDFWKELGVAPTPMNWGEVYTALQQGTVDGQENPVTLVYSSKFQEVQKYMSLTRHVYEPAPALISKKKYDSLPEAYQKAIKEAAQEAAVLQREFCAKFEGEALQKLKEAGMQIEENPNEDGFRAAAQKVRKVYAEKWGLTDLMEKISNYK